MGGYYVPENVFPTPCSINFRLAFLARRGLFVVIRRFIKMRRNSSLKGLSTLADTEERWLGLTREEEHILWDRSMIFGYGPRVCLGKEYALFVVGSHVLGSL